VFPRDIGCLRNICVDALHKGDTEDDDDDNDDDGDNNNVEVVCKLIIIIIIIIINFKVACKFLGNSCTTAIITKPTIRQNPDAVPVSSVF
jgi:hypothetical protein